MYPNFVHVVVNLYTHNQPHVVMTIRILDHYTWLQWRDELRHITFYCHLNDFCCRVDSNERDSLVRLLHSCMCHLILALEKFLGQAKLYPEETSFDIVAKYCETSGECAEIVSLLEGLKRKPSEVLNTYLMFYILMSFFA